ncbi:MAG: hypothetical protein ACRD96_17680 [Bryobacteraceae bacterium]
MTSGAVPGDAIMLSISLIVVLSLILFVYWFRYSCLLILQTRAKTAAGTVTPKGLSFAAVQEQLRSGVGSEGLDRLHDDLRSDYRILSFLLQHSSDMNVDPIEQRMLILDYRLMQLWYQITRRTAPPRARRALEEMSHILGYFAQSLGRRTAAHSA